MSFKSANKQKIKIETIQELALSRFIHHSVPDVSRFLRSQNINNISDTLSKAVTEERALKISSEEFQQRLKQNLFCTICKRNSYVSKSCFKNRTNVPNYYLIR